MIKNNKKTKYPKINSHNKMANNSIMNNMKKKLITATNK